MIDMTASEQLEQQLNDSGYSYEIVDGVLYVTHKGSVDLRRVKKIGDNVQFNNGGYVDLESLTSLPNNVQFNNGGDVYLRSLTSLPDNVQFNNKGYVYLESLTSLPNNVQFNNGGYVYLESLTSLPDNVQFSNEGNVGLRSLTSLPNNVQFNNEGSVDLESITSLPDNVQFNNGSNVYLESLTSLPDNVQFNNGGFVDLHSLTSLPNNVQFNNGSNVYLESITNEPLYYKGKHRTFRNVDGYTMLMGKSRNIGDTIVHNARYFGGGEIADLRKCYIAEQNGTYAHGATIAEAQTDLRFKIAQVHYDKSDLIEKIRSEKRISFVDFRLLTGACSDGLREGLKLHGYASDLEYMSLDELMALESNNAFLNNAKQALRG